MRSLLNGTMMLAILLLTACGSISVQGDVIPATSVTKQAANLSLHPVDKKLDGASLSAPTRTSQIEATASLTVKPTSTWLPTNTPVSTSVPTSTSRLIPGSTPAEVSTPSPVPFNREAFWPDPRTPMDIGKAWDFGADFFFTNSVETNISFLAFWLYPEEPVSAVSEGACLSGQGRMPSGHPERPFWSTGTETVYAPGQNSFHQTYHYPGSPDGARGSKLALWLIQRQGGQIVDCLAQQYDLVFSSEWPGVGASFFPDISKFLDRNSEFYFGVTYYFTNDVETQVRLLAFPIYADEIVPEPGMCQKQQGRMPATHPDRPFWSTGTSTTYPPGPYQVFSQTYRYSNPIPDATHLVLWLIVQQTGNLNCIEQIYQFQ